MNKLTQPIQQHTPQGLHGLLLSPKRISVSSTCVPPYVPPVYTPRTRSKFRAVLGYTLLELMVVLAIVAIIAAAGAPSVRGIIDNNAQISAVNSLVSAIGSARATALTRKREVFLESLNGNWSNGFNVKIGDDTNAPNIVPELVTSFEANNRIVITSNPAVVILSFDYLGRATPAASTFRVCNTNTRRAATITVNFFGNPVISRDATTNRIIFSGC